MPEVDQKYRGSSGLLSSPVEVHDIDGASGLDRPLTPAVRAVLAERAKNIERAWDPLHRLGFEVVDERGNVVPDQPTAIRADPPLTLRRLREPPFALDQRRGFFTHSLVGNALLLLIAEGGALIPPFATALCDIGRQPNRHYLCNALAVVLGPLILVRHGETEANRRGIILGRSNGAEGWRGIVIDQSPREPLPNARSWHCSSLLRTVQTAEQFGITEPSRHTALDEMEVGVAEGLEVAAVDQTLYSAHLMCSRGDAFAAIVDEFNLDDPKPAGECFAALLLRVADCLENEILARRTARFMG
jgi:hypothetical protein